MLPQHLKPHILTVSIRVFASHAKGSFTRRRVELTDPRTIFGALKFAGMRYLTRKDGTSQRSCETTPIIALPAPSTSGLSKRMPYDICFGRSETAAFSSPAHSAQASSTR